jgi:hypothetical protein
LSIYRPASSSSPSFAEYLPPHPQRLARMAGAFDPGLVSVTAHVVANGVSGGEIAPEAALSLLSRPSRRMRGRLIQWLRHGVPLRAGAGGAALARRGARGVARNAPCLTLASTPSAT